MSVSKEVRHIEDIIVRIGNNLSPQDYKELLEELLEVVETRLAASKAMENASDQKES